MIQYSQIYEEKISCPWRNALCGNRHNGTKDSVKHFCGVAWHSKYGWHKLYQPTLRQLWIGVSCKHRILIWRQFQFVLPKCVPIVLNYLLEKKSPKQEVGFGASLGIYHVKEIMKLLSTRFLPKSMYMTNNALQQATALVVSCLATSPIVISTTTALCSVQESRPSFNFCDKYRLK